MNKEADLIIQKETEQSQPVMTDNCNTSKSGEALKAPLLLSVCLDSITTAAAYIRAFNQHTSTLASTCRLEFPLKMG